MLDHDELLLYVTGELDATERARVEERLARDPLYRAELEEWRAIRTAAKQRAERAAVTLPPLPLMLPTQAAPQRNRAWVALAGLLAAALLIAFGLTLRAGIPQTASTAIVQTDQGEYVNVVVALRDLPRGIVIPVGSVELQWRHISNVPANAIQELERVEEQFSFANIEAGQIITTEMAGTIDDLITRQVVDSAESPTADLLFWGTPIPAVATLALTPPATTITGDNIQRFYYVTAGPPAQDYLQAYTTVPLTRTQMVFPTIASPVIVLIALDQIVSDNNTLAAGDLVDFSTIVEYREGTQAAFSMPQWIVQQGEIVYIGIRSEAALTGSVIDLTNPTEAEEILALRVTASDAEALQTAITNQQTLLLTLNVGQALRRTILGQQLEVAGRAVAADPENPELLYAYGIALIEAGGSDEPINQTARQLRQIASDDIRSYDLTARAYLYRGEYQAAINIAEQGLEIDPTFVPLMATLAQVYTYSGLYQEGVRMGEQATALDPTDPYAFRSYATTLIFVGRNEDARAALDQAFELDPGNPNIYFELANVYRALNQDDRAIQTYMRLLEIDPLNPRAYLRLGQMYAKTGDYAAALDYLDRALALDPTRADVYREMGRIRYNQRDYAEAIELFTQCQYRTWDTTSDIECYYLRGLANLYLNHCDPAWADLRAGQELSTEPAITDITRQGLVELRRNCPDYANDERFVLMRRDAERGHLFRVEVGDQVNIQLTFSEGVGVMMVEQVRVVWFDPNVTYEMLFRRPNRASFVSFEAANETDATLLRHTFQQEDVSIGIGPVETTLATPDAAPQLAPGDVAVAIPVDLISTTSSEIQPGMLVDIYVNIPELEQIAQGARVMYVGRAPINSPDVTYFGLASLPDDYEGDIVTVAMMREEAERLTIAVRGEQQITLSAQHAITATPSANTQNYVTIIVADRDIPRGTLITEDMVRETLIAPEYLRANYVVSFDQAVGRTARVDFAADAPLSAPMLMEGECLAEGFGGLGQTLRSGCVSIVIPYDRTTRALPNINRFDPLDIYASDGSTLLANNVTVIWIGETADDDLSLIDVNTLPAEYSGGYIVFSVTMEDAQTLQDALQQGQTLTIRVDDPLDTMQSASIVIAVEPIPSGTTITSEMVESRRWPIEVIPAGSITDLSAVVGQIALTDIVNEEPVLVTMVSAQPPARIPVIAAARDLPVGQVISAADVLVIEYPREVFAQTSGVFGAVEQVEGMTVITPLSAGTVLNVDRVIDLASIPSQEIVNLPVDQVAADSRLQAGMGVDIYSILGIGSSGIVEQIAGRIESIGVLPGEGNVEEIAVGRIAQDAVILGSDEAWVVWIPNPRERAVLEASLADSTIRYTFLAADGEPVLP